MIIIEIFKLFGSIFIDNDKANESIAKTEKKAESLSSKLGSGIKTAAKWGAGIAAGAAAAGTALFATANKAADATDRIDKMSQKLGLSRKAFQEWDFILSQNGVSIDSMKSGMKTLTDRFDELSQGGKVATDSFSQLGIKYEDLKGLSREEIFEKTITALQGVEDEAKRAALANDLLGRSGQELAPLLNAGAGSVEELKKKAHDLGLVLGDEAIDAGVKFTDTIDQLKRSFGAVFTQVGTAIMPIMQSFAEWIIANMPTIQAIIGAVFSFIKTYVDIVVQAVGYVIDIFKLFFNSTMESSDTFMVYFEKFKIWFMGLLELLKELVSAALTAIKSFWEKHGESITAVIRSIWDIIKTVIDTALKVIKDIIKVATAILKGDWQGAWDAIKQIFVDVWEGMKELLPKLLVGIFNVLKASFGIFKDIGKSMFEFVWEGMKSIWESITNWVGNAVKWLKNKLMFWKKSKSEMNKSSISTPSNNSYKVDYPGLASGGEVIESGRVLVGEVGPEILELPKGAKVRPLDRVSESNKPTIIIDKGAFEGAIIMDDYGVDRLMDRIIERMAVKGVG